MDKKILVVHGVRVSLENFIVTETIDRDYKISISSKDTYLHDLILSGLGSIKDFVLIDEHKQTVVKNAKVVTVSLATNNTEEDMIKFVSNSVSYTDNPFTEYKKSVFSLLKLYDEMDKNYVTMIGRRPLFQISGFRRYGNTTILLDIAKKYKNSGEQVAIISATEDMNREIPKQHGMNIVSLRNAQNHLKGKKITVVLFDNHSIMNKDQVEDVMRMVSRGETYYCKFIGLN
jgi:hypothetical protein